MDKPDLLTKEKQNLYESISVDDSSDEEDEVESYDIIEQINKFKADKAELDQDTILSFISHAAGIYTLYSPPVQKRYYELKKDLLLTELEFKSDDAIKKEIETNISKITQFAGKLSKEKNEKMQDIFKIMKEDMLEKIIQDKVSYLIAYQDYVKEYNYPFPYLHSVFPEDFNPDDIPRFGQNISYPIPVVKLTRKTLSEPNFDLSGVPKEDFIVEFLSYLRLHNRSEKRCLKNKEDCKDTTWKLFESKEEVRIENKSEYNLKGCRDEKVLFKDFAYHYSSYTSIFESLSQEEKDTLLDTRINIRKIDSDEFISDKLLSFWYLLFGCEVIKNPAALIHHNMAFDLIKSDKLKWGKEMIEKVPMFPEYSISKAMRLNCNYTDFMPHKYLYQIKNDYDGFESLIKREAAITKAWLELKLGKAVSQYLIKQCQTDDKAIGTIWELIMESFDRWDFPKDVPLIENLTLDDTHET